MACFYLDFNKDIQNQIDVLAAADSLDINTESYIKFDINSVYKQVKRKQKQK